MHMSYTVALHRVVIKALYDAETVGMTQTVGTDVALHERGVHKFTLHGDYQYG